MFLTTDDFYTVQFKPTSDAAWASFTPRPGFQAGALADAIVDGSTLLIYVIDAASGYFAYVGGQGSGYDDTHLAGAATTLLSSLLYTTDQGQSVKWAKNGSLTYTLDPATFLIQSYAAGDITALKAFLP